MKHLPKINRDNIKFIWAQIAQEKWEFISLFETLASLLFRAYVLITVLDYLLLSGVVFVLRLWVTVGGFLWVLRFDISTGKSIRAFVQDVQIARQKNSAEGDSK